MNINEYLDTFFKGTKDPSLDAMKYFMDEFNHPEKKLKIIHIAGTNGKGSCTEMMSNVLIKAGYKVGKFLSPHLIKYNERISINGELISDSEMEELINEIKPKIEAYNKQSKVNTTLFELETTMALLYFERHKCDFVVMEVGLGGTYDCTNIVHPLVSIINSIGYDHMHLLGNTLEKIAKNKAGIIKENSKTVFVEQEKEVNDVIINKCIEKNNELHLIKLADVTNYSFNEEYQKIDYKEYKDILINLKGEKQIYNASLCLETINILKESYKIPEEAIREGLKTVVHHARFEKLLDNPVIIYDGAHNEPAIKNLKKSIEMYYKDKEKVFVVSILNTKDYKSILKHLMTYKNATYIFTSGNDETRYTTKEELYNEAQNIGIYKEIYKRELTETINFVKNNFNKEVIFIVGSFYIYGDVLEQINNI
ncbi:MAG: bifunctional folylpolyglutamate synthase/dihydrofolate synthase [Clostridiales bacterium]|nr:bifunctional folylpolyglutamate synthase/dihydrofolate synthase [Clostridiales bacterium]